MKFPLLFIKPLFGFLGCARCGAWLYASFLGSMAANVFIVPAVLAQTNLWDGQYEMESEGAGGVLHHNYLIFYTEGRASRVILNGKELSRVSLTATGFHGRSGEFKIPGSFVQVDGTNAVVLVKDDPDFKIESNLKLACTLETVRKPFLQTHGRTEAAACYQRAVTAMKQYDRFLAQFRAALELPDQACLEALRPLMEPLLDARPTENYAPLNHEIHHLTLPLVRSLKLAGYKHDSHDRESTGDRQERSLVNGPFEYILAPNHASPELEVMQHPADYYTGFCGDLDLKAEIVDEQMRITAIEYFP